jgi:c-di-GMP-binding flagellar brake protein YcgR
VEWVAPDVVKEGMSVRIDAPAATGMRSGPSVVRAIHKRWLALAALESDGLSLGVGAPLEVQIHTGPALYRFHTSVRDRRIVQGVPTLYVERPPRIEKVQRRSHFRVDLRLAAALSDLRPDSDPAEPIRGVVDSLSGGGFRICLPTELPAGTPVRLRVSDEPLAGHALEARVIRCDRGGFLSGPRFRACCEFVHLSEETRNLIVAHCFEIQREAMRSGA